MRKTESRLDAMLAAADKMARKQFAEVGEVPLPCWLFETDTGEQFGISYAQMDDVQSKITTDAMVRKTIKERGVVRYIFFAECWVDGKDEGIIFSGEDRNTGQTFFRYRPILRPVRGRPTLAPPVKADAAMGRFLRMFEPDPIMQSHMQ
jgi:hypothetical protein